MIWKSLGQAAISSFGAGAGKAAVEHVLHGGKGRRGTLVLKKTIGPIKVYFDREWEEYILKPQGSRKVEEWYHTDDKEDAFDTAKVMAKEHGHRSRGRRAKGRRAIEYAELTTAQERALIDAEIAKFPAEFSLPYEEGKFRFEKWPGSFVTSKNEVSLNLQEWNQSQERWEGMGRYTPAEIRRMGIKGSGARGRRASGRRAPHWTWHPEKFRHTGLDRKISAEWPDNPLPELVEITTATKLRSRLKKAPGGLTLVGERKVGESQAFEVSLPGGSYGLLIKRPTGSSARGRRASGRHCVCD